jgi:hypothetical protein
MHISLSLMFSADDYIIAERNGCVFISSVLKASKGTKLPKRLFLLPMV